MFRLLRRNRHERIGFDLYGTAVAAAREPYAYEVLGVPDTLDGRFDMVGLHAFLLIRRTNWLPPPGPAVAQAVFDAMFADMDQNLREIGVGDLSVGKKVRAMWEAFHGRATAYEAPIAAGDAAGLAVALARNLWRGALPPAGADAAMARLTLAQDLHLAGQADAELCAGRAQFLPAAEAAR